MANPLPTKIVTDTNLAFYVRWKFRRMGIYENRNLQKWKIEIWKITNFEKSKFGKMYIWKNAT